MRGNFYGHRKRRSAAVEKRDCIVFMYLYGCFTALRMRADRFPIRKDHCKTVYGEPGVIICVLDLIGDLVMSLENPTIVECNTACGGSRSNTTMHYQVAEDHGYTAIADVNIMDKNGSMTLTVEGGDNLTENYVGVNFANYDYFVVLSHFKGHAMAGFGGAIKNISIGIASSFESKADNRQIGRSV